MTDQNDQIIIQNILSGNVQAYATLVNAYKDMAVVLAYNILLNREDAEEAAQDAFVSAYNSLPAFRATSKFSTWLYRIILNTALNKKKLKKYYLKELTDLHDELPPQFNHALATQVTGEQRKQIRLAMSALNQKERLCITLFYLNELSVEEISELTGISRSSIKVLLHRGRKNLYTSFNVFFKRRDNQFNVTAMEQDKNLQKILLFGAETASVDFTATVMKKVTELSASPIYNQPLVSNTLKKTFLVTVGVLVALILLLGLLISFPTLPVVNTAAIRVVTTYIYEHYANILTFVISFWIVFLTKSLFEKKVVV